MGQFYALLAVAVTAGIFVLISYYRKQKIYPICDRFATRYCELSDRVLNDLSCTAELAVEALGGDMLRMKPLSEQPLEIQMLFQKPVDSATLGIVRELYILRDEIQSHASNGNLSKDKYNAITNQVFDTVNTFLSMINRPQETFSKKDLDNFHYYLHKQKHIRNVTLPSIVSKACVEAIAVR